MSGLFRAPKPVVVQPAPAAEPTPAILVGHVDHARAAAFVEMSELVQFGHKGARTSAMSAHSMAGSKPS